MQARVAATRARSLRRPSAKGIRSVGVPDDHRARLDANAAVTRRCGLLSRFGFDHYRHFHLAPRRVPGTLLLLVQSRRLGAAEM